MAMIAQGSPEDTGSSPFAGMTTFDQPLSMGERFKRSANASIMEVGGALMEAGLHFAPPQQVKQPKEIEEQYGFRPDAPMSVLEAMGIAGVHEANRKRDIAFQGGSFAGNLGPSMVGAVLNPLNLAFVLAPELGATEAVAGRLGLNLATNTGKITARALGGAAEFTAVGLPVEAAQAYVDNKLYVQHTWRDSLNNIAMNAAFGALAHPIAGAVGDWAKGMREADVTTKETAISTATAQLVDERPITINPVFEAAGRRARPEVYNNMVTSSETVTAAMKELDAKYPAGTSTVFESFPRGEVTPESMDSLAAVKERIDSKLATDTTLPPLERSMLEGQRADIDKVLQAFESFKKLRGSFAKIIEREAPEGGLFNRQDYYSALQRDLFESQSKMRDLTNQQKSLYDEGYSIGASQEQVAISKTATEAAVKEYPKNLPQDAAHLEQMSAEIEQRIGEEHLASPEYLEALQATEAANVYEQATRAGAICLGRK